ncbi:transcriptional repressor NrdR [bacterium]|nr:MAG: transcriptional regulator NrdR [bacterium TMED6]RCL87512.1 MAG: transcriptional repressor NrdR [bacterium]|tara:strand:+ start:103 stop:558 length:456 start_codon:yes stop_codon:yes gene_type:complete
MKCTNCSSIESKVVDSRLTQDSTSIRRRRECLSCGFRYTSYEYILKNPIMVVKKTGVREEYDRQKIEDSFRIACKKRPIPQQIIEDSIKSVEDKITDISNVEIDSRKIGELVMIELKRIDSVSYIRFSSVYREFKDLSEFQAQIDDLKNKF